MGYLSDKLNDILSDLEDVKRIVKEKDPRLFEAWKAGGFIIDTNVLSRYPNIEDVVESLEDEDEVEDEDE